nr:hypothetical protein [Lachnospiraceae bacterium]
MVRINRFMAAAMMMVMTVSSVMPVSVAATETEGKNAFAVGGAEVGNSEKSIETKKAKNKKGKGVINDDETSEEAIFSEMLTDEEKNIMKNAEQIGMGEIQVSITEQDEAYFGYNDDEGKQTTIYGKWYKFVPDSDGEYTIESFNFSGDPFVELYDSEGNQIAENDDSELSDSVNFRLSCFLKAGATYYYLARSYDADYV